ncbi:MAG: hypothetical protein AAFS10_16480 [Myxococcota bacterium]
MSHRPHAVLMAGLLMLTTTAACLAVPSSDSADAEISPMDTTASEDTPSSDTLNPFDDTTPNTADTAPNNTDTRDTASHDATPTDTTAMGDVVIADTPTTPDTRPQRDTAPPSCTPPESSCGAICADLQSDPNNCGGCGRTCVIPNAEAGCSMGDCTVGRCAAGFFDADGQVENGCEVEDTCISGGLCETTCGTTGELVCEQGLEVCSTLPEQCNAIDDDCDGICDEQVADCRAGIHRGFGSAGHVYSDDLGFVNRNYNLERENYFYLYSNPYQGMRPVFLCLKPNNKRFLTAATDCEVGRAPERQIGFWSPSEQCGATPLYRLYNPADGNHFYTISAPERDNARDNLGFIDEGTAAWVWTAP